MTTPFRKTPGKQALAAGITLALSAFSGFTILPAMASSHREAPMISAMPALDGTDFYMFRSYEPGREGYVTFLANYFPLQDAYGGPNYFNLDDKAVYEIHIDNNGDSVEDLTFSFSFTTIRNGVTLPIGGKNVAIPLINAGAVGPTAADTTNVNVRQEYALNIISGNRRTGAKTAVMNSNTGSTTFRKPLDNIGSKSIADYTTYANSHIYPITAPGCPSNGKVFVGQRAEGFAVNLGAAFDLVNLNPLGSPSAVPNVIGNQNVTTLALEIPLACLTKGGDPVIGAWTTSSMNTSNGLLQVSRLGFPLVNELIIGLPDKDKFNFSEPKDDGQFATYVTNPTLPALLELLFSSAGAKAPTNFPRMDMVAAITGVAGLNQPMTIGGKKPVPSEMLRLNTSIAPAAASAQNNLGVLASDLAGFPNGRRPGDDVVDIALRVVMGALNPDATIAPNNMAPFTDQSTVSAADFPSTFPYLNSPRPGAGSN
ncbi:MAG: DUF4331 domain-containing protein [Pseudomonadota bacterium]